MIAPVDVPSIHPVFLDNAKATSKFYYSFFYSSQINLVADMYMDSCM